MNNTIRKSAAALLLAVSPILAQAGSITCGGTVDALAYHQPGKLMLRLSSMNTAVFICSTDAEWVVAGSLAGNTSVSACKTIYASLLSAKMTRAPLSVMYFDGDQVPASCASFANWSVVNVRYYDF